MPTHASVDVSVQIWNGSDCEVRQAAPIHISDICSELLSLLGGTGTGIQPEQNPNAPDAWVAQAAFGPAPSGLDFVSLNDDGSVDYGARGRDADKSGAKSGLAGFVLSPRTVYLDAKLADDDSGLGNTSIRFDALKGKWKTTPCRMSPAHTRIYFLGGATRGIARSRGVLPANRAFFFDLAWGGVSNSQNGIAPWVRLIWGSVYALFFQQGAPAQLQRMVLQNGASKWALLKVLPGPNVSFSGMPVVGRVLRFGGRLCVEWAGQTTWWAEPAPPSASGRQNEPRFVEAAWPAARLQLECSGCRVGMGLGLIKYASAGGAASTGGFGRFLARRTLQPSTTGATIQVAGWQTGGATIQAIPVIEANRAGYNVTLASSADGIDTPLLSKVLLRKPAQWGTYTTSVMEFATACVGSLRVTSELPSPERPNACNTASLTLSDALATSLFGGDHFAWREYAEQFRRIRIAMRQRNEDGSVSGDFVPVFDGYILDYQESVSEYRGYERTLICKDATCRLQAPAGVIAEDSPPLDLDFLGVASAGDAYSANGSSGIIPGAPIAFYGRNAIALLAERELGPDVANGALAYFSPDHYPVLDTTGDRCGYLPLTGALSGKLPFENGFLFPAPYLRDMLTWMQQFAGYDAACLWFYWPTSNRSGRPRLLYGRLLQFLNSPERVTHQVPDAVYQPGDENRLMLTIQTQTKAERNYNEFLAVSSPPGTELGGALPGLRMARAALSPSHRFASWRSWRRTHVIENEIAWAGAPSVAGVDALVIGVRNELQSAELIWPTVTVRGDPTYSPGDKAEFALANPFSPILGRFGFNGQTMRVQRVEHTVTMENRSDFKTGLSVRPLIASEV